MERERKPAPYKILRGLKETKQAPIGDGKFTIVPFERRINESESKEPGAIFILPPGTSSNIVVTTETGTNYEFAVDFVAGKGSLLELTASGHIILYPLHKNRSGNIVIKPGSTVCFICPAKEENNLVVRTVDTTVPFEPDMERTIKPDSDELPPKFIKLYKLLLDI